MEVLYSCDCKTITHHQIGVVLKHISDVFHAKGFSQYIIRKVYSISSECLDNILQHGYNTKTIDSKPYFEITYDEHSIYILAKNVIKNQDLEHLQHTVALMNEMRYEELKPYFQNTIKEKSMHTTGGAGVGLIMIKRKSELPIELMVESITKDISYVTFNIELEIGTMKKFKKLATKHTPLIHFSLLSGLFTIEGVSRPENADAYYQEVLSWVEEHEQEIRALQSLVLHIELDYINSVSLKNILRLFRLILSLNHAAITFEWVYDKEDESSREEGEELSEILKKEFVFIEKK